MKPLLTREQERALADRIQAGDLEARNELVMANQGLVRTIVRTMPGSAVPQEDLVQDGNVGLMRAADMFRPRVHDVKFSSYAAWWIHAAVSRAMYMHGPMMRFPEYVWLLRRRIIKAIGKAAFEEGRYDPAQVAVAMGEKVSHVLNAGLTRAKRVRVWGLESGSSRVDSPARALEAWEERDVVLGAIEALLTPIEAAVVRSRNGIGWRPESPGDLYERRPDSRKPRSYRLVGLDCGLSQQDAMVADLRAIKKLREFLSPFHEP